MAYDPHKLTNLNAETLNVNVAGAAGGEGEEEGGSGKVFYVCNATSGLPEGGVTGSDSYNGTSPLLPKATIDSAIGECTSGRGDKIIVLPNHAETITSAVTLDVTDVTIEGRGRGDGRPQISCATASIDVFTVTAANCKIENLLFNEVTAAVDSLINIAAADCVVEQCQFDVGASNTNPCITHASGARFIFRNNEIHVTADGPNEFYLAETAVDGCRIESNLFDGGSASNSFDDAHIDLGSSVVTDMVIRNNAFAYGTALVGTGNAHVSMYGNEYLGLCIPKAGIPLTIYVDPSGSTTGAGSKEDPTTLAAAVAAATAGSKILLYPGSYTLTAALALDDARCVIQPVDYIEGSQLVTVTTATADIALFTVTAESCVIRGLRLTSTATMGSQTPLIDVNSGGDQLLVSDCYFDFAANDMTEGVDIATGLADCKVTKCKFVLPDAGDSCILNAGAHTEISYCRFDLSGGEGLAIEELATPGAGTHIHHCVFSGDGTDQTFVSWQSSPSVGAAVHHCVVTEAGTTNDWLGDDSDLDTVIVEGYAAGGAAGATTVIDPSVT